MSAIRAVVVDSESPGHLALRQVEAPQPAASETLVRVAAISLNRGEVRRAQSARPGARLGWDIAGTVEAEASDGSGPRRGQRVVGVLASGAWAELVAVPTASLAVLPDSVSFSQAATLPVAGLTALYALEKGGGLLDRKVLITGASGGVGLLAVQLAVHSGARVTGLVRQQRHASAVREAGAYEVVVDEGGAAAGAHGPYNLILESVGGLVLGNVLSMLAAGGTCILFGVSAGGTVTFDAAAFFRSNGARLQGFMIFNEFAREPAGAGLSRLAQMVADGRLRPRVEVEAPWTNIGTVAQRLIDREFPGKAVLLVQ